ncbi:hypothetical protein RND81_14G054300 [Saponaria officinalis]|uniref:Non-structural maintenance of chromosomes element 4 n=1 Tax=Saponaria officinalis TaxID=3572 RepID=A0AAW1GM63_SAPOF
MAKVKKEIVGTSKSNCNGGVRELRSRNVHVDSNVRNSDEINQNQNNNHDDEEDEVVVRRNLRSKYLAVKNLICGENEDSSIQDSDKFKTIFNEVESLHKQVRKPREQVADAEALLDITSSFVKSVKAQRNEGATPADLVSCLLRDFGRQDRASSSSANGARNSIIWKDIGLAVSHIFLKGPGCSTMLGPMNAELKIRKTTVRKKHVKPTEMARPEELNNASEEKTDTDKNMLTMFGVLRKHRKVRLENLVLNRTSFAQTVENLFALSFLVKDGRAEIAANGNGHFVCPKNAPDAKAVESGKVCYSHFVFRFDFKDWKVMLDTIPEGEELMPHRVQIFDVRASTSSHSDFVAEAIPVEPVTTTTTTIIRTPKRKAPEPSSQADVTIAVEPETTGMTTPIRKRCRNRGLVLQEQTVVEDSPESDDNISRAAFLAKKKSKLI